MEGAERASLALVSFRLVMVRLRRSSSSAADAAWTDVVASSTTGALVDMAISVAVEAGGPRSELERDPSGAGCVMGAVASSDDVRAHLPVHGCS